ncbi:MAG: PKD domain-containing protein [bacterium]
MCLKSGLWAILLAAFLLPSCKKEGQVLPPVIHATLSPVSGNTTQTFSFDLSRSESRTGRGSKVFTRWDWDGDGNWDTPFTRLLVYEHRYYVPDTWKPRLEMTNLDGASDTLNFTIAVARGYSAPKPGLTIVPGKGHIYTRFLLDASATRDDEDSLDQLSFRWDFEGDGQWDTSFGDSVKIFHVYPETGFFEPKIQVRDPSGLISSIKSETSVTMDDPRLYASFRCIPDSVTDNSPIFMDASASSDLDYPDKPLMYRWDWENDQVWDTEWLTDPQTIHLFKEEYIHFVRLQVRSYRGLQNEITQKIRVWHKNRAPVANFSVSALAGNVRTEFRFDGWSTYDIESAPSHMFFRWDFDGDGRWDTEASHEPALLYRYQAPGIFNTRLEVTDSLGESDTFSKVMSISHGTNETGMYLDIRGCSYEYYGTVLIGDQWWFTRSLSVRDQNKTGIRKYEERYYNGDESVIYRDYGCLYRYDRLPIVCPAGWRVPSREDWEKLFAHYPADKLYEALMPGGISDFGATLGGKGKGIRMLIPDCDGLDDKGYFWSTSFPLDPTATSIWVITFDNDRKKVLKGFDAKDDMWYGVRCVKDR